MTRTPRAACRIMRKAVISTMLLKSNRKSVRLATVNVTRTLILMPPRQGEMARKCAELKKSQKDLVSAQRRERMLRMNQERKSAPNSAETTPSKNDSPFRGKPHYVATGDWNCSDELSQLSRVPPNRRRFSTKMIALALAVYLISGPAYNFLRDAMPLPSRHTLNARTATTEKFNPLLLQNISGIDEIVKRYRETNELDSTNIYGVLAVDAIAFDREMVIGQDGFIKGSIQSESLDSETLERIQNDFCELEKLWQEKLNSIISDAFVFQFHPLNAAHRPFVVHIHPSTQGKATNTEVELLDKISEILERAGIKVIGYAMDGDSTYRKLHKMFFSEYGERVRKDASFVNFSGIGSRLIISDPLHVLKRARYRLLGSRVHTGLTNGTTQIEIDRLVEILHLPSKVFSNQHFTKMHDDLPVSLFSLETLVTLASQEPSYLSYFLPFCLLNSALTEERLSLEERINFLEVAFYYMLGYLGELSVTTATLPNHKSSRGNAVRLFSEELALETTNTLASLLAVIYGFNMTLNLNRIGTNPLEHTFGTVRMRSKCKHTYEKMVKSLGDVETWKRMVSIVGVGGKISGRRSCYGKVVNVNLQISPCVLNMNPRDIAVACHIMFSLPISSNELECWNLNYIAVHSEEIMNGFLSILSSIHKRLYPVAKTIRLNSRSILLRPGKNHITSRKDVTIVV